MDPENQFDVMWARSYLLMRVPERLRNSDTFRHFYTDQQDAVASCLSIKYFSLVILHFCTLFRLEGRRRQYLQHETEKSGRDFAAAHSRAKVVFEELTRTYGLIVLRYNRHSEISYAIKTFRNQERGPYSQGLKSPIPARVRFCAFSHDTEEIRFYEELFHFTVRVVRLAFNQDEHLKTIATEQLTIMFRSKSFAFADQRHDDNVRNTLHQLELKHEGLLDNNQELAELLVPAVPKLIIKYANIQRTPFFSTLFPGGTSGIKYRLPDEDPMSTKKGSSASVAKKLQENYVSEVKKCTFPSTHRAWRNVRKHNDTYTILLPAALLRHTSMTSKCPTQNSPGTANLLSADAAKHVKLPLAKGVGEVSLASATSPEASHRAHGGMTGLHFNQVQPSAELRFEDMVHEPPEAWIGRDLNGDIQAVFQGVANGVIIRSFALPSDLLLSYDPSGFLMHE